MGELAEQVAEMERDLASLQKRHDFLFEELKKTQAPPAVGDHVMYRETGERVKVEKIASGAVWAYWGDDSTMRHCPPDRVVVVKRGPSPSGGPDT